MPKNLLNRGSGARIFISYRDLFYFFYKQNDINYIAKVINNSVEFDNKLNFLHLNLFSSSNLSGINKKARSFKTHMTCVLDFHYESLSRKKNEKK